MYQRYFAKYVVALLVCLVTSSCSKESSSSQQQTTENFRALVMGGMDIDPNQTWSTASSTSVSVSVSDNQTLPIIYTVYIFQSHPASSSSVSYLGMTTISSGETKTINVAKPNDASQLYAACYDADNKVLCMPVINGQVSFSGNITTTTTLPTITTGNNWSVPTQDMPDLTKYTSGTLVEVTDLSTDLAEDAETHVKISEDYSGFIPFLSTHTNMSVYVTSTWTLTYDQRINSGNVIVVGEGGKIVIPDGFKMSTVPAGEIEGYGYVYVLNDGVIYGEGTLELASNTTDCNYNLGTIETSEISIPCGTLCNAGFISDSNNPITKLTGPTTASTDNPAQLINYLSASFSQIDGTTLTLLNGGFITVLGNVTLANSTCMDDGSTFSCGSLTLQGNGSSVLYMGNSAYLKCSGSLSVSNYGIWGPSGSNYTNNARIRIGSCSACTTTSDNANSYMLDHVQLIVPTGASGLNLLSGWMNGAQGDVEESRQTCLYELEGTQSTPNSNYVFYGFEVPDNYSIRDFDYNDVILRVGTPYDNSDGTYTISVNVAAIGSTQELNVIYNGEDFGKEVHEAMGIGSSVAANTSSFTRNPQVLGMITVSTPDVAIDKLSFSIRKKNSDGSTTTLTQSTSTSDAPLYIVVNGDAQGKWRWPKESSNISLAYPLFSTWANNAQSALDWYNSSNGSSNRIISW